MLYDSHCHLTDSAFTADFDAVLARANAAGVRTMLVPGTDVPSSRSARDLADSYEGLRAAAGIHPHEAAKISTPDWTELDELLEDINVIAVGEIGLDYHYDFSPRSVQREVFRRQLEMADHHRLPVIIHSRESIVDTLEDVESVLSKRTEESGALRGVFHSYSDSAEMAVRILSLGFMISIAGWVTFKRSPVAEFLKAIPDESLLLETDAPYLTPVPFRGKRNEPAFLRHTAEAVARARGQSIDEVEKYTSENAIRLFGR